MRSIDTSSNEVVVALQRCEDACRALVTRCLQVTPPSSRGWPAELLSDALDVAYVAGATARVLARYERVTAELLGHQLAACEAIALAFADVCDRAGRDDAAACGACSLACASACAEARDALAPARALAARR